MKRKYYRYFDSLCGGYQYESVYGLSHKFTSKDFRYGVKDLAGEMTYVIKESYGNILMEDITWRVDRDFNVRDPKKSKHIKHSAVLAICKKVGWENITDAWPVELRGNE